MEFKLDATESMFLFALVLLFKEDAADVRDALFRVVLGLIGLVVFDFRGLARTCVFSEFLFLFVPHLWQYQFWFLGGSLVIPMQCLEKITFKKRFSQPV